MLQRLVTLDLPTQLPQSKPVEEPAETPRYETRRPVPKKPQLSRLERMESRERLLQRLKSPSKERPCTGGSRHRFCCQPTEALFLPAMPEKLPPRVVMPPSPFGKLLRSAPTVPQAPLRPLRQATPRSGYPFTHRSPPLGEDVGSGDEAARVRLPSASARDQGGATGDKIGGFLRKFKCSTEDPELLAAPQKSPRPADGKGVTMVYSHETPADGAQEAKTRACRVSVEAAEQLRQQMRARLTSQEAVFLPAPEPPPKCGDGCGPDCTSCRRKSLRGMTRGGVSFAQAYSAGQHPQPPPTPSPPPPEERAEPASPKARAEPASPKASNPDYARRALLRKLTGSLAAAAAGERARSPSSSASAGGDFGAELSQDALGIAGAADGGGLETGEGSASLGATFGASDMGDTSYLSHADTFSEPLTPKSPTNPRGLKKDVRSKTAINLKSNLQERLKRLEKRHVQRKEQLRANREQDLRRQKFNALPKEEVDAIERVFSHVDRDGVGSIEQQEIMDGLKELGLRGINTQEKREIAQICSKALAEAGEERDGNAVDIVDFALVVVPRVRNRLTELRSNELLRQFYALDIRGTGKLDLHQCLEGAREMGIDQISFRKIAEEVHRNRENGVDFETFQEMIIRAQEHKDRLVRERERRIKSATGISDAAFQEFRRDIVDLHALFQRYDMENDGKLSPEELPLMLTEFGLMPKTPHERIEVTALLQATDTNNDGVFSFEEFLHLTRRVRTLVQERKRASLQQFFERYDRDKSGNLSIEELSALLCDLGVVPQNRKEQEELAALIQLVDADGSGFIDFEEFVVLSQRIDQRLKSMRYEEEIEFALSLNFTESQLRDMRLVFISLDVDGSNRLDATEVRNGLQMMNKQVCNDAFDAAFKALDTDNSGELDFLEFLDFMRMMRDGEGIFCEDTHHLPSRVRFLDARVLRRVVAYFGLSKTYVSALGMEELVELFCNLFEIYPHDNLQEKLSITSVGELFEVAKKRGGQHFRY